MYVFLWWEIGVKIWLFYPYLYKLVYNYVLTVDSSQTCYVSWSCVSLLFTFVVIFFVDLLF